MHPQGRVLRRQRGNRFTAGMTEFALENRCREVGLRGAAKSCYGAGTMRPVEARYEDGILRPEQPLPLRPGELVGIIVVRRPDPARWDLARIAAAAGNEDADLSALGLDDWTSGLDREDVR